MLVESLEQFTRPATSAILKTNFIMSSLLIRDLPKRYHLIDDGKLSIIFDDYLSLVYNNSSKSAYFSKMFSGFRRTTEPCPK